MSHRDSPLAVVTLVSGGQTGADRAALDFALEYGLPHDGWCPRGRRAEDGPLDLMYRLQETESANYEVRTRLNIEETNGTVVFSSNQQTTGGTALTIRLAKEHDKPLLHLARDAHPLFGSAEAIRADAQQLCEFIATHQIRRLNVAGPRASQEPAIANYVWSVLSTALVCDFGGR